MVIQSSEPSGTSTGASPMPFDFEVFVRANSRTWLRYARTRLQNLSDAEDAVQETAVRLFTHWKFMLALPEPQAMQAFALRVLKGKVSEAQRARARDGAKVGRLVQLRKGVSDQDPVVCGDHMLDREGVALRLAMEALGRTDPLLAEAVRLRMLRLTYREIGEALGIASTTAKTWVSEGWRWLDQALNKDEEGTS
ncbi:RNA polymerase sigma factor [Kitasatospora fiedleri]|uniref:RNA polymerase sigma factor n=1 Tax=Kitasatospora fiedleri TaxID=2991545 RepID=UPI00249ABB67|nr:RNA polymerase sigma factor [Kitasatospora fiedleri]